MNSALPNPAPKAPAKKGKAAPPANTSTTLHPGTAGGGSSTGSAAGGAGNTPARPRSHPAPAYPPEAKRNHEQGVATIRAQVSAGGSVTSVALVQSSGFPLLDQAALAAVRGWSFDPARVAGVPAASSVEVPVRFQLTR